MGLTFKAVIVEKHNVIFITAMSGTKCQDVIRVDGNTGTFTRLPGVTIPEIDVDSKGRIEEDYEIT